MKPGKLFASFLVVVLMMSGLSLAQTAEAAPVQFANPSTTIFINEIHYDNTGADSGEAVEVAGPAGTDLTGWSIALYNGSATQLNVYGTISLSGVIPDQDNGYGTLEFPRAGIQNGSPDGLALVDEGDNVIQFLSYEGDFTPVDGPAVGMTSTDIGVSEPSDTMIGYSLQLTGSGTTYGDFTWAAPQGNSFGAVNTGQTFSAPSAPFVNEIHYDNTGSDTGEAIEIAGLAGTDLTGWSLVLYNGNGGAVYGTVDLSGVIPDQQNGYGTLSFARAGIQNGSPDGLALVDSANNVIQFLSYEGEFTAVGGPADGMTSTDIGVSEPYDTPVDYSLQLTGTGLNYGGFTWTGPILNTFGAVNTNQFFASGPSNPSGTGAADPDLVAIGEPTLLTVAVTPGENPPSTGLAVSCDLSTIGDSATQAFSDNGDGTFSYTATPNSSTSVSSNNFPCTISDAEARTGTTTIGLDVIVPIGTVQGSVGNSDDGFNFVAPLADQTVTIQGVIYENTLARTSSGSNSYTFFIQNTEATSDGDPNSSDGIFVYIGRYSTLRIRGGGYYTPTVGDEVILQGPVQEYYGQTELSNPYVLSEVNQNVDIPAFVADPPADLADAYRYWERREGMRGQVPTDSLVLNGRNVFASTADAEVWVASPDSDIAQRTDPYTRRAFRDAHPLDDNYNPTNWDGNGYRILMGSLGIKAAMNDNTAMINPARTFDTVDGSPTGGVYFDYGKYSIQVDQQVAFNNGPDPAANNPPATFNRTEDYSIVDYNLENLYDYRDNPFSGCDFAGDSGCPKVYPFLAAVSSPFNYVPESDAVYQARLNDIALQIINDLHGPDILMVQEIENQDFCAVTGDVLTCGEPDNVDGKPDVLQELALKIASLGGPIYDAAFDSDSSDLRGIAPAFMYRTDSVQLLSPEGDPVLGGSPAIPGYTSVPYDGDISNPKTLNAVLPSGVSACETSWVFPRAPSVGLFRIWRDGIGASVFTDVYVVNNHFKSGPDSCVAHRTEQAKYNAAIVSFLQDAKPNARIVVGGDLNVYPRPDDIGLNPDGTLATDQLGSLYDPSLGLTNLWEVLLGQAPEAAYSYVYVGMAQTLDQMFANQPLLADLGQFRSAHINSDFPADYPIDVARGTSDHDPQFSVYSNLPTLDRLEALVMYYDANGLITGNNTTQILLDRLAKARRFYENGKQDAYMSQLQAFIDQVYDFTPEFIPQDVADALATETALLMSLP